MMNSVIQNVHLYMLQHHRIPQLLTCLVRNEGTHILNLLCSVGKAYPQAVYFPIRTLYLTLKLEQREKCEPLLVVKIYILFTPSLFPDKAEGLLSQPSRPSPQPAAAKQTASANDGVEPMQVDHTHPVPAAADSLPPTATGPGAPQVGH